MDSKVEMKTQNPSIRIKNFKEVELGYNHDEAIKEANRCLQCKKPMCITGCPVEIMIPEFIKYIKEDNIKKAYEVISNSSFLPSICGRVCPQERQCESKCIKGLKSDAISIGALERYVADNAFENNLVVHNVDKKINKKVAVVGSGPAGLTCASELAKKGVDVVIYEVLHEAGGVLTYGIPEFRLPKSIVKREIESVKSLGVKILTDVPVGNSITIDELTHENDAVFIASGAGLPKFMGIKGEDANEVFSANEILTRINLMKSYKNNSKTPIKKANVVYVIGGGNVAMDAARSLRRLGMEVHLMYRRSMDELPARKVEVTHAKEEGIIFDLLRNPKEIIVDENNKVIGMKVVEMKLDEAKDNERRAVKETDNIYEIKCDMVVMALGTSPNHEAIKNTNIIINEKGLISVEDTKTSLDKVYAGGDAVSGSATVILAMQAGKKAAMQILNDWSKK